MSKQAREHALEEALYTLYLRWWHDLGYRAERFRQMIVPGCNRYVGGIRAVQHVLTKKTGGFDRLRGPPELTVEYLVAAGEWNDLISEPFRSKAGIRLQRLKEAKEGGYSSKSR